MQFVLKIEKREEGTDVNSYFCNFGLIWCAAWWSVSTETDEVKKKEKTKETLETTRSKFLVVFESIVKANGGKHLVGNSLTWADLYVAHVLNHVELEVGDGLQLLTEFPELRNLCENVVSSSPGIKKWIENRPLTKY